MPRKPALNTDEILNSEYQYIAQNVFQSNEDRSRVTSFYFVSVGSFVAAILGTRFEPDQSTISLAFFFLFTILTFMGALTIAQLARLRAAWHEAVEAMNQIKDYYIKHMPELEPAFKWRKRQIPPTNKPYSIANLMAVEVALLSALTTGAGIYFLMTYIGISNWVTWSAVIVSVIFGYIAQWTWYRYLLVDNQ
ncbi:MAG TPA: hypothetical protein PKJ84_05885 [Anaerolineales bacterium]|nr:hypothetical protein [Anaerolineales bacterium]HNB41039.1 hypothetical protein [Anaerolineales bacterium]HNF93525.1 hypothetical protein [Anaerolineales bacterium]HNH26280.1 hypothetical protein [Anaerolineales bacterium]HNM35544.1 hypothetical protein [Anaerolineales bacterium]